MIYEALFSGQPYRIPKVMETPYIAPPISFTNKRQYINYRGYSHPELEGAKDLILALLTSDPKRRMTVAKAVEHPWFDVKYDLSKRPDIVTMLEDPTSSLYQ